MYLLIDFVRESVAVFLRTAPFLLIGFFLAGALRILVSPNWLARTFGRANLRSVFLASLTGVPLPLCSCSVLPTAIALRKSGASKGATVSFLISTPETGLDSISITYALMDPMMTVARPLAAFGTAMAAGLAVNATERAQAPPPPAHEAAARALEASATPTLRSSLRRPGALLRGILAQGYGELLDDISPYLLSGIALTGLIGALVPDGALANPLFQGFPAMLVMLLIGIPLYVCATGSTPVVAGLLMKGLSPGAALVFLLAGPATNAAGLTVLLKVLGRRAVAAYLGAIAGVSLLAGAILDSIYTSSGINAAAVANARGEMLPLWIEIPAALLLLGLILRSAARIHMLSFWRERLERLGHSLGVNLTGRGAALGGLGLLFLLYLLTGVATLRPGEVGWVQSFGAIRRTVTEPGLVVHAPFPFATFTSEPTERVYSIDRGFREGSRPSFTYDRAPAGPAARELTREAEIATGDENLLSICYSVQYSVADAYTYRFRMDDPRTLVAAFGETAIRRVMAEVETDSILVNHRRLLEARVADQLRAELAVVTASISILRVDLLDVHAPAEVHFAFRDVASAMEDRERFVRQAESYRNWTVATARGQSHRRVAEAEGKRVQTEATAQGAATGFSALAQATRGNREITRLRLYLETAERVLPAARLILPLIDIPIDVWLRAPGAPQLWPEATPATRRSPGEQAPPPATAPQEETWREKLRRLQESTP